MKFIRNQDKNNPSNMSAARMEVDDYLMMVKSIMGGITAMREGRETYLPKFESEEFLSYDKRVDNACMTNVFADIVENISQKPFKEKTTLTEDSTEVLTEFAEDLDGRQTNLHSWAAMMFESALVDDMTWTLIDYTQGIPEGASVAEERAMGARPIWVHYLSCDVLAVYSEVVAGKEQLTEVRLRETDLEHDGFAEKEVQYIRVFRHPPGQAQPTWELWKEKVDGHAAADGWEIAVPPTTLNIDVIPMVPVIFGRRRSTSWIVKPPLRDAAHLQVELYQKENGLKNVRNYTAYPMLAANGMEPAVGEDGEPQEIITGPNAVLYGGTSDQGGGSWAYLEPAGHSLTFLRDDIKDTIKEMRELGRQPLTAQSGNLTVITTAFAAQKGNTAIQAWVRMLEESLERMFEITAKWLNMGDYKAEVSVYDDFDLGLGDDASFEQVLKLAAPPEPLISRPAVLEEAKRRGIIRATYDIEEDLEELLKQYETMEQEQEPELEPAPAPQPAPVIE